MSRVDENLEVVRRADRAWNGRDWVSFEALHAQDVFVRFTVPGGATGRVALIEEAETFLDAFPDHQIDFPYLKLFGEGDLVCSVTRSRGTHTGPWKRSDGRVFRPTGKRMEVEMTTVARVLNGEIVERIFYYDTLGMMTQLGLVKIPGGEARAA
ncbi:MAG: ester cyclase [Candidatus Manganitrophaceae bacterium]|nr:MAG: ester cyclase [Candidatus Manganitrophaceae bacterium]